MRQDRKLGARAANWLSYQIRALGSYAQTLIADGADNLSDVISKAVLFWLSPSGRPIAIITFVAIIAFAVADTAYLSFRPRTSSLAVHVFDAQHQCTECAPGQWKAVASRVLIEGRFAYGTDPGCLSEDSFLHEAATIGRMIIFAPATLAIGSTIEAYDLEIVRTARNHYLGGTWLGRQLEGKDNQAAECALLAIPIPLNLDLGDRITIRGRSTKPKNSTLGGDFAEKSRSDRGKWYGCPTGGELRPCGSDFGADLRPLYKPAYTAAGNYTVVHTMMKNWYHEDGFFTRNPREVEMSAIFTAPDGWAPDAADISASIRAASKWVFRQQLEVVTTVNGKSP